MSHMPGSCMRSLLKKSFTETLSSLREGLKLDLVAQPFESSNKMFLDHLPIVFVEVIAAQVLIGATVAQEMIDDDQDAVANSDRRTFGAAARGDAAILCRQIRLLAMSGGVSSLDEEPTRVGIALAGLATEPLARALMIAWTDADPGVQVFR